MTPVKAVCIRSFGGPEVRNFRAGDTVYVMRDGGPGGYAEYAGGESGPGRPEARARAELREIGELVDQGRVHPHVPAVFELREAPEAQAWLGHRHAQGKVVLQVG